MIVSFAQFVLDQLNAAQNSLEHLFFFLLPTGFRMLPSNATDGTPLDRYPIPLYGSKNALKTVQMPDLGHILGTWHSLSAQKEFWNVSQEVRMIPRCLSLYFGAEKLTYAGNQEIRWIDYRAGLKGPA